MVGGNSFLRQIPEQMTVARPKTPKTLEEAFGVDGEKAIEVARMIVAERQAVRRAVVI